MTNRIPFQNRKTDGPRSPALTEISYAKLICHGLDGVRFRNNKLGGNHGWSFCRGVPILALTAVCALASLSSAVAATLPSGFTESSFASGLSNPTAMEFAPDGRLFVCQQSGQLRVVKNGLLLAAPFLTATVDANGERGLLGIAFDPNFAVNHFVYIYYTAATPAVHNRVSRFTANGDTAVAGSEMVILDLNNLSGASNHNGGAIHFGGDGKLYIVAGENANSANSQTLGNLLGKMLRINPDGTIPTDNPFYNTASGVNRAIWALGLRNPFTFAVQPGTGRIFINDVGENTWEEINDAVAGANHGWPNCEGDCSPANPSYRNPIFRYSHGSGATSGNAIAGGVFYNPTTVQFPGTYTGMYFFADYTSGWIRKLDPANGNQVSGFATGINSPVDLKVGSDGRLYYLARGSGAVYAISYTGSGAPQITQQPVDQTVTAGQSATFTVTASGTPPLNYRWQRAGTNIPGATTSSYTLSSATTADDGVAFRCVLTNASGAITSNPAYLNVSNNNPPVGTITSPPNGGLYTAGNTIQFAGTATDPEDGLLPASAFSWTIVFHHDTHTHPFLGPTNGVTNGSFVIPTQGHTEANVWYRVNLTVTDSGGRTQTSFRDVRPRTATVSLTTSPPGLQVTLEGQPVTTPVSVTSVVGVNRTLGAVSPQTLGGTAYEFVSWSDGGAATHTISSPPTDTTYTAMYRERPPSPGLAGTYFDNPDFTSPKLTRNDSTINFDWGNGSPDPAIGSDTFSVRWVGQIEPLYSQSYTFYALTDDGFRLWVNNQLLIDGWLDQPPTERVSTPLALTAGSRYDLKIEYYENAGGAVAKLSWSSASQAKEIVPAGRLFPPPGTSPVGSTPTISNIANQTITVNTATAAIPFTVADSDTPVNNLTLSKGSSNPTLVPANNIVFGGSGSSRTVTVTPAANQTGSATITVTVSDGSSSASDTFVLTVNPSSTPSSPGLAGTYFDNPDFTNPKLTRNDSTINFDWGNGSPDPSIGVDTFSVRWVGQIEPLYSQSYTFYALTDDGFRLWVNNQLLIDSWIVQPPTERVSTPLALTAGTRYDLKIEYYENGGGAVAKLSWSSASQAKQIVPAGRLFPPPGTSPGGSTTPTISNIPDQATTVNTATAAIPFTINDTDTPVNNLTLSKGSSNPTLVPANNIVFGGSGSSRTVTVTPAANQTGSATITVTVSDGSNSASDSFVLTVTGSSTPPSTGLAGTYFDNPDFTSPKLTRNDSTINFDWGNGSPDPAIGSDTFSVRWVGQIEPLYSQSYTFYALTDDGFRLWVNNQLLIDSWIVQPATERVSTPIALTAGSRYDIKIEYYENAEGAVAKLSWSSASQAKQIVPAGRLFPPPVAKPTRSSVSVEPPRMTSIAISDQGAVRVTVSGPVGLSYTLETSSDLLNWTKVNVQENVTGSVEFVDQPTTNAVHFYRAVSRPE